MLLEKARVPLRDRPYLDEQLTFEQEGLDAPAMMLRHASWFRQVQWDTNVLKFLPTSWRSAHQATLLSELNFWTTELQSWNGKWLSGAPPPTEMQHVRYESDASKLGGGLVMDDPKIEARWHWRKSELHHSINFKELVTPVLALPKVHERTGRLGWQVPLEER